MNPNGPSTDTDTDTNPGIGMARSPRRDMEPAQDFETCRACGSFVVSDQRYCLKCGELTTEGVSNRDKFVGVQPGIVPGAPLPTTTLAQPVAAPTPAQEPVPAPAQLPPDGAKRYMAYGAFAAGSLLLTALVAGAIGAGLNNQPQAVQPTILQAAAAPAATTAATGATAGAAFTSDWPKEENGWTVQIREFDQASAQPAEVAAFKQEVTGKGLEAGALDSSEFGSLTPKFWIVYAGMYKKESEAKKALKAVTSRGYADAEVIEVSNAEEAISSNDKSAVDDSKIEAIEKLPPEKQAKERAKLPDETALPGEPPPKDNKAPGDGSEEVTIDSFRADDRSQAGEDR